MSVHTPRTPVAVRRARWPSPDTGSEARASHRTWPPRPHRRPEWQAISGAATPETRIRGPKPRLSNHPSLCSADVSWAHSRSLRHKNDVAWFEAEVVLKALCRVVPRQLRVIERNLAGRRALTTENHDTVPHRELGEPSSHGEHVEDGGDASEFITARCLDLADHRNLEAVHRPDDHGQLRRRHVRSQRRVERVFQLRGREAGGLHVVEQRERNPSVRPDRNGTAHVLVVPDRDVQHVFRSDHVLALANRRTRVGRFAVLRQRRSGAGQDRHDREAHEQGTVRNAESHIAHYPPMPVFAASAADAEVGELLSAPRAVALRRPSERRPNTSTLTVSSRMRRSSHGEAYLT